MAIPELCHLTTQELFHLATLHMSHHHIATPGLCHMATLSYVTSLCLAARKLGRLVTDILGSCGRQTILAKESRGENWELLGRQPIQFCVANCRYVCVCVCVCVCEVKSKR